MATGREKCRYPVAFSSEQWQVQFSSKAWPLLGVRCRLSNASSRKDDSVRVGVYPSISFSIRCVSVPCHSAYYMQQLVEP